MITTTQFFQNTKRYVGILIFSLFLATLMVVQGCKKEPSQNGPSPQKATSDGFLGNQKKRNPGTEPSPSIFYFNCGTPDITGKFLAGKQATVTIGLSYVNGNGAAYPAFTSTTVNGITLNAPAGTLNTGAGVINLTASGIPTNAGFYNIPISINGSPVCPLLITVLNAPVSGPNADPGTTPGSTGVVNFTYKGQSVAYKTVRAKDGLIWLQQNLGSPQVAFHELDQASFGDLFQWGRWDDGHQTPNSSVTTGGASLQNPSHITSGNMNFIIGNSASTRWWGTGGASTDTWSGNSASSSNGKDPCSALGTGWRLPTIAEWQNINILEDLGGTTSAFQSNLKLTASGYRLSLDGGVYTNGDNGSYWSGSADGNSNAKGFFFDNNYNSGAMSTNRGEGFSCRCVKQ